MSASSLGVGPESAARRASVAGSSAATTATSSQRAAIDGRRPRGEVLDERGAPALASRARPRRVRKPEPPVRPRCRSHDDETTFQRAAATASAPLPARSPRRTEDSAKLGAGLVGSCASILRNRPRSIARSRSAASDGSLRVLELPVVPRRAAPSALCAPPITTSALGGGGSPPPSPTPPTGACSTFRQRRATPSRVLRGASRKKGPVRRAGRAWWRGELAPARCCGSAGMLRARQACESVNARRPIEGAEWRWRRAARSCCTLVSGARRRPLRVATASAGRALRSFVETNIMRRARRSAPCRPLVLRDLQGNEPESEREAGGGAALLVAHGRREAGGRAGGEEEEAVASGVHVRLACEFSSANRHGPVAVGPPVAPARGAKTSNGSRPVPGAASRGAAPRLAVLRCREDQADGVLGGGRGRLRRPPPTASPRGHASRYAALPHARRVSGCTRRVQEPNRASTTRQSASSAAAPGGMQMMGLAPDQRARARRPPVRVRAASGDDDGPDAAAGRRRPPR